MKKSDISLMYSYFSAENVQSLISLPPLCLTSRRQVFSIQNSKIFSASTLPKDCFLPFSLWMHCKCGFGFLRPFLLVFVLTNLHCSECFLLGTKDALTTSTAAFYSQQISTTLLLGIAPKKCARRGAHISLPHFTLAVVA